MRILFTHVALSGHLFPLVPLAWACRALGHDVLVTTTENFVPTVLRAGLPAASCGPAAGLADLAAAGVVRPGTEVAVSQEEQRYAHGRAFARIGARSLAGTLSVVESWRPDLVVSERAELAGPIAAAVHGVPRVEHHWGIAPLSEYRPAALAELGTELAAHGLTDLGEPAAVLNPWPPSVRLAHTADHRNMRYVPYNGDARVPGWLLAPRRRPRVCLTLGTVLPRLGERGVTDFVLPVLESLAGLGVELVVAVDDEIAATWPPLPAAVRHAGRVPMSHVLRACDVSINHGGQGTALTALEAGCPQVVLPQFDDQFDNADAIVKAGAGLRLLPEEISPHAIVRCCRELLDEPEYGRTAAGLAAEIAAQPSTSEIVGLLTELAEDPAHS